MRTIKAIQKELAESKELATAKGLKDDEKEFIDQEIKDLEQELEKAQKAEKTPAKCDKEPKKRGRKPKAKKTNTPKKQKDKVVFMIDGKPIDENDPKFCDKIIEQWKKRKEERKKAAGTRKTKPITQKVAANVASAVIKGIKSISIEDIKKDPKQEIKKMERFEKAGKEFLDAFKGILGKKITQKEINEEFSGIDNVIKTISKKYLSEKMEQGGYVKKRRFTEYDYNRLVGDESEDYPFFSIKDADYWVIKEEGTEKEVAEWYPENEELVLIGRNAKLLSWLKRNSY